ncbi:MAG TPA: hypothetical protein V6C72_12555, partial [Chroococcales cyanobacterium]
MNSDPTPNSSSHSDSQPEPALHGATTGRHPASQPKPPSKTSSAAIIGAVALVSLFCLLICLNWHKLTHRIGQDEAAGEGTIKVVPVVLRKL